MNRTDGRRPHPIVAVLRDQGRLQSWLARKIGRNPEYLNRVFNGVHPAVPSLRADCARILEMDEAVLFHDGDDSSGDRSDGSPEIGSDDGAGVAVARAYSIAVEVGVGILDDSSVTA